MTSSNSVVATLGATALAASLAAFVLGVRLPTKKKNKKVQKQGLCAKDAIALIKKRRSIFPRDYQMNVQVPRDVLDDMLEAARWAPTQVLAEAWHFVVFDTLDTRSKLGYFLARQYKQNCKILKKEFHDFRFYNKIADAAKSSYVVAVCVNSKQGKTLLEEVCSVSCAIQNMQLVAAAHQVGVFWSSCFSMSPDGKFLETDEAVMDFLNLSEDYICLGWVYIGSYGGNGQNWPQPREKSFSAVNYRDPNSGVPKTGQPKSVILKKSNSNGTLATEALDNDSSRTELSMSDCSTSERSVSPLTVGAR